MARFTVTQPGFPDREVRVDDYETAVREAPTGATVTPTFSEVARLSGGRALFIDSVRTVYYYEPAASLFLVKEITREIDGEEYCNYIVSPLCKLY